MLQMEFHGLLGRLGIVLLHRPDNTKVVFDRDTGSPRQPAVIIDELLHHLPYHGDNFAQDAIAGNPGQSEMEHKIVLGEDGQVSLFHRLDHGLVDPRKKSDVAGLGSDGRQPRCNLFEIIPDLHQLMR